MVIFRLNTQKSLWQALGGRSGCMTCQNKLSWYELFPVFSFLGLRGRCKNCKTKISIQYPLVELATGFIFAALFFKFQYFIFYISSFRDILIFGFIYLYYAFMFSLLLVIAVYDLRHKIILDKLSLIFGILAFLGLFLFHSDIILGLPVLVLHIPTIFEFLSGFLIAFPFAFFWLVSSGRWMGLGDAKLALGIGWWLGFSVALSALVWAFWIGAIVGISLILFSKKYKMKSEIPFAPYLVLGAFLVFIFSLHIFGF